MRNILYFLFFLSLTIISCTSKVKSGKDGSQTSELDKKAVGQWELSEVVDEFGDKTGEKCLRLIGDGTYSSKYENEAKLTAVLFILQDNTIQIKLYKKGSQLVDDYSGHIKIKDGDGNVHDMYFDHDKLGQITPFYSQKDQLHGEGEMEFREIIQREGIISLIAEESAFLNFDKKTYNFKFNLNGFNNAIKYYMPSLKPNSEYSEADDDDDYIETYPITREDPADDEFDSEIESGNSDNNVFSVDGLEPVEKEVDSQNNKESTTSEINNNSKAYDAVDEMPQFPGGPSALFEYLAKSIQYPSDAEDRGAQGKVICNFVVETDGSISDINVAKSVDPSLDKEAKRVISSMPNWIPGKINGKAVRVRYTVPVTFRLQ